MPDTNDVTVAGRGGLRGKLVEPASHVQTEDSIRIRLDDGRLIEVPTSVLVQQPDGQYEMAVSPADLEGSPPAQGESPDETVIPVFQEQVVVGKRAVQTGGVRVHRRTEQHEEVLDVPLRKEKVDIRRVAMNKQVEGPMAVRREGNLTIIPVVEEVLQVSRRYVLKEEIHVTRTVREERHQERVVVERQHAEVEHVDNGAAEPQPRDKSLLESVFKKG